MLLKRKGFLELSIFIISEEITLHNLLKYCSIKISDLSAIVFYDKPFLKFERLIETYLSFCPKGFKQYLKAIPIWVNDKLFFKKMLIG